MAFRKVRLPTLGSLIVAGLLCTSCGAPKVSPLEISLREMRSELSDLQHVIGNLNLELEMVNSKSDNQEALICDLQQELSKEDIRQKQSLKTRFEALDHRLARVEKLGEQEQKDIRSLKSNLKDSSASLAHYKKKLNEVEGSMGHLHQALTSLSDLVQDQDTQSITESTYEVQAGDTLGEIAEAMDTTVQQLKRLNRLSGDRILVGQKLRVR